MNALQISALRRLTNKLQANVGTYADDHLLSFAVEEHFGSLTFVASNLENSKWYSTEYTFFAIIGPKGGVRKTSGTITL